MCYGFLTGDQEIRGSGKHTSPWLFKTNRCCLRTQYLIPLPAGQAYRSPPPCLHSLPCACVPAHQHKLLLPAPPCSAGLNQTLCSLVNGTWVPPSCAPTTEPACDTAGGAWSPRKMGSLEGGLDLLVVGLLQVRHSRAGQGRHACSGQIH